MTTTIDLPDRISPDRVPGWFEDWQRVRSVPHLSIRGLNAMVFEPASVALLAAGLSRRNLDGLETRIELDPVTTSAGYLRGTDFLKGAGLEIANSEMHLLPGAHVPLHPIRTERDADEVARECDALLQQQLPTLASSVRRLARNVIEELGVNVVQHSGAPGTGFAMAQAWPDRPRMQIAVADAGVGFLASFQRHLEFKGRVEGEGEALQLALHTGLTSSSSGDNSGLGLGMLRDLSDKLRANLWMASGTALLHRRTVGGQRVNTIRPTAGWRGSWICMDASLDAK